MPLPDEGIKYSALPAAGPLDGTEKFPVVQGGVTKTALTGTLAPRAGVDVYPLENVSLTALTVRPMVVLDGVLYGAAPQSGAIQKSLDNGATWTVMQTVGAGAGIESIWASNDGEVLVNQGNVIYRSTGWSTNPATATFSLVLTATGASTFQFDIDVVGSLVIAAEYNAATWADSKNVYLSQNNGRTFSIIFDKNVYIAGVGGDINSSHLHHGCIDALSNNRLFICFHETGAGTKGYVLYSDNLGGSWSVVQDSELFTMTTMTATTEGIVCGSDGNGLSDGGRDFDGLYTILRRPVAAQMKIEPLHLTQTGFTLFAVRSRKQSDGTVLVAFESSSSEWGVFIMASPDGRRGSVLYESSTQFKVISPPVVAPNGDLLQGVDAVALGTDRKLVRAAPLKRGAPRVHHQDRGGLLGADRRVRGGSIAAGRLAKTSAAFSVALGVRASVVPQEGVAVGYNASVTTQKSVALGALASAANDSTTAVGCRAVADGFDAIAIGTLAKAHGTGAIVIGKGVEGPATSSVVWIGQGIGAYPSATDSVAIGAFTKIGSGSVVLGWGADGETLSTVAIGKLCIANLNAYAVAVGAQSEATGSSTVALGRLAKATALQTSAVGSETVASHFKSVALGMGATTTEQLQVAIGARHIELAEQTAPANAPTDKGRLFLRDNGSGKTQLCVIFQTGAIQVLSTEP